MATSPVRPTPTCLLCKRPIAGHEHIVFPVFWVDGQEAQYFTHERCWAAHPLRRLLDEVPSTS